MPHPNVDKQTRCWSIPVSDLYLLSCAAVGGEGLAASWKTGTSAGRAARCGPCSTNTSSVRSIRCSPHHCPRLVFQQSLQKASVLIAGVQDEALRQFETLFDNSVELLLDCRKSVKSRELSTMFGLHQHQLCQLVEKIPRMVVVWPCVSQSWQDSTPSPRIPTTKLTIETPFLHHRKSILEKVLAGSFDVRPFCQFEWQKVHAWVFPDSTNVHYYLLTSHSTEFVSSTCL